jgi:hypothetical protein
LGNINGFLIPLIVSLHTARGSIKYQKKSRWTYKRIQSNGRKIRYTKEENNNVMSRYDHKIETSLEGIEHLSKEKKEKKERKMK